jgi:Carboxypeptidase regulatory-like domain
MTKYASPLVCFLAVSIRALGFQAPPQASAKGSIEGQIVNAKTGAPLKRAMVRLVGMNPNPAPANPPAAPAAAAAATVKAPAPGGVSLPAPAIKSNMPVMMNKETDEQGHFVFTGLDPGRYRITAERQGFLRQSYGARKFSGGSTPITVGDGQSVKSIDVKLTPQSVISGKVLDEDGEPVSNVQIRAQKSVSRNGRKQWSVVANANTSDIGEYRLPELQPGRYVVFASARNSAMNVTATPATEPLPATPEMAYAGTFYPSTADAATAMPVDVGEGGEIHNIDIRLVKTRVFRVRGKVSGMAGARGNVPVTLTARDGAPGRVQVSMAQARGPEGIFEIRNVPPGQYLAHAQTQTNGQQYVAVAPVDVAGSHVDGLVLALSSGGDVQGSVKVADADAPVDLTNLRVMLRPVGFGGQAPRATVGEDLKFTLKSVPPVHYAVTVAGYPDTCYVKSIQFGGADVTEDGVQMTSGGTLDVVISAAAGQMDLVVMTKDGKAANGSQVLILRDGAPMQSRSADENGMLSIKGLKPGDYKVIAWEDVDPNQLWDTDYLRKFENDGKSIKIGTGGHEAAQIKAIPPDAN